MKHTEMYMRQRLAGFVRSRGVQDLAREWGCSRQYIYDVLKCRREPGPKILKHLGLKRIVERRVWYRDDSDWRMD